MQKTPHHKKMTTHIELNGKIYDAHSGRPVEAELKSVDSVHLSKHAISTNKVHNRPERSHTLMRHAVKKPHLKVSINRPQVAIDIMAAQIVIPATPLSLKNDADEVRTKRAKTISRSSLVSRFGDLNSKIKDITPEVKKSVISLAVVPPPAVEIKNLGKKVLTSEHLISKALRQAETHHIPVKAQKKNRLHHKVAKKIGVSARMASLGMAGVSVLVLGAFIAYQNMPNFAVRYASAKAGLSARLPAYKPAGFAVNKKVQFSPGQITISFRANADNRAFNLTQTASNWSSEALVTNYLNKITSGQPKPQPYSDGERTIYLYGDANATWVSEGVWYEITGNSSLTTDQLLKIANSI